MTTTPSEEPIAALEPFFDTASNKSKQIGDIDEARK